MLVGEKRYCCPHKPHPSSIFSISRELRKRGKKKHFLDYDMAAAEKDLKIFFWIFSENLRLGCVPEREGLLCDDAEKKDGKIFLFPLIYSTKANEKLIFGRRKFFICLRKGIIM